MRDSEFIELVLDSAFLSLGDSPPFSTTRQNLSNHTAGMPLATSPRTFQDAIKVTRAL